MKKDLRVEKTEEAIRTAFYQLIREKDVKKITVREIAERARINKTTFYSHYASIYDFIDTLEQEAIDSCLAQLTQCNLLFDAPELFVRNLYESLLKYTTIRYNISSRINSQQFSDKIMAAIQKELDEQQIDIQSYGNIDVILSFLINGIIGLQKEAYSYEDVGQYLENFVRGGLQALNLIK